MQNVWRFASEGRGVLSMQWSPMNSDLFCASFASASAAGATATAAKAFSPSAGADTSRYLHAAGLVQVWDASSATVCDMRRCPLAQLAQSIPDATVSCAHRLAEASARTDSYRCSDHGALSCLFCTPARGRHSAWTSADVGRTVCRPPGAPCSRARDLRSPRVPPNQCSAATILY
ncbi:hypothetical protein EON66_05790 [archaeon]|nr:MAG: hypothetical protein EON66_05790 [archaeon]